LPIRPGRDGRRFAAARAEDLGEEIFAPVISGTISEALGYSEGALVSIAEFLAAHRALLTRYLSAVSAA
jgi:hypothetical protein